MASKAAISLFQNQSLDREINPQAILIGIWNFSSLKQYKDCGLGSRIYSNFAVPLMATYTVFQGRANTAID